MWKSIVLWFRLLFARRRAPGQAASYGDYVASAHHIDFDLVFHDGTSAKITPEVVKALLADRIGLRS